jgi:hypothetical protein
MNKSIIHEKTTYPYLAGFGITAGENMREDRSDKYSKEQWLWKTYGEGIRDARKKQPDRDVRLIHRFHMTGLAEINNEFKDFPTKLDLSIKYSIAHMYSIPNPPFAKGAFEIVPKDQRLWLTVRNDDIYSFRWGNPDFARQYLKAIPGQDKIAGYYMGSDGYCWVRDFLGKDGSETRLTPLQVADSISKYSRLALIYLQQLPPQKQGSFDELTQTLGDIEAFATFGNYYKEKIRGACSLALYNFYGLQQDKDEAINNLIKAKSFWFKYAAIYDLKYKPANYNRVGLNIPDLVEKTEKDIQIAKDWKAGDIKEYKKKPITEDTFQK